ncbi:MAG: hypothetical protein RLZZ138_33 [Actinomycetota bacterium]|jgi:hypothetical protein
MGMRCLETAMVDGDSLLPVPAASISPLMMTKVDL